MTTNRKTVSAVIGAAGLALVLSGCVGNAQQLDPAATGPLAENTTPAAGCAPASGAALVALTRVADGLDDSVLAKVQRGDGGWYLGAATTPTSGSALTDDDVAVWGSTDDPSSADFDGQFVPVNDRAQDARASAAPTASGSFSATSNAAELVQDCVVYGAEH